MVASKQLKLAMETEEERRARLENDAATKRFRLVMQTEEERKERLVKMVATTQLRLALMKEVQKMECNLIWIEIGFFKNFKECARSPCNGNRFSSNTGNEALLFFFFASYPQHFFPLFFSY